jgi:hypothetical protein
MDLLDQEPEMKELDDYQKPDDRPVVSESLQHLCLLLFLRVSYLS